MNEKKTLEELLYREIVEGTNDPGFISLIKLSQDKGLFFDDLYETFFVLGLNKSFFWEKDQVVENYPLFGLNQREAGEHYCTVACLLIPSFILYTTKKEGLNSNALEILTNRLLEAGKSGIILPDQFFNHPTITHTLPWDYLQEVNKVNKANLTTYLEQELHTNNNRQQMTKI